ncbi:MAG: hypothetical protein ACRC6X_02795 [Culicoidibacterales bacterium]
MAEIQLDVIDYEANIRSPKVDNPFHPEKLLVERLLQYQADICDLLLILK